MFPRIVSATLLVFLASVASAQEAVQPEATSAVVEDRRSVTAEDYMVASANSIATQFGVEVLQRGGTAADAAVAVQFALNLVEPQSSGIGGGAFLIYWDARSGTLTTYDGREMAPAAATPEYWFGGDGEPVSWFDAVVGGRSVGVPGTLKLLETVHQRYGNQHWSALIEPTRALAEGGFQVSPRLSNAIAAAAGDRKLDLFLNSRVYFFDQDGHALKAGTILRNPEFADTLDKIQRYGARVFYEGTLAHDIVSAVRTNVNGGIMTLGDLRDYRVIERAPVCIEYRSFEVCGM
ncbi:MAG: gamma-glutamyltransferase, partial [Granulosicoccus sp.]